MSEENESGKPKDAGPGEVTGFLPSNDTVKTNLTRSGATPEQISAVLWLLDYGRSVHLRSISKLAERLNIAGSSLSRLLGGKYGADISGLIADINHFRQVETERKDFGETPMVETEVVKHVKELCDLARVSATMAMLWGPNQSGKTTALKSYTERNNHGRTIYARMPVGGGTRLFLIAVLRACGITDRLAPDEMRDRILRYFDPQTLLIVDEVHQAMIGRTLKTVTIEFIREVHDLSGCGVVLCGTDVLPDMMGDARFKKFLGQTDNRGVLRRRIPPAPCAEDIRAICNAYGFPPAEGEARELAQRIAKANGIGKLTKFLRMARKLASGRKEPVGWRHFLITHATLTSWAHGEDAK